MPIYEYECDKCGVFEQSQSIKDPALTKCPTCRRKVRRLISNTSFQLKGSGWYVTDYARGGKDGQKGDAKSETKSDAAGSESKSESKAEKTKTETKSSASSTATTAS